MTLLYNMGLNKRENMDITQRVEAENNRQANPESVNEDVQTCPFCGALPVRKVMRSSLFNADTHMHPENRCWISGLIFNMDQWNKRVGSV